jgi:hypothetical protein
VDDIPSRWYNIRGASDATCRIFSAFRIRPSMPKLTRFPK